jgi:hypothetical protein
VAVVEDEDDCSTTKAEVQRLQHNAGVVHEEEGADNVEGREIGGMSLAADCMLLFTFVAPM